MGYTHYFNQEGWDNTDKEGWKKALPIIKKILQKHKDIIQFEYNNKKRPVANDEKIRFNGIGDEGHETFGIENEAQEFSFCKTARKPYDLVVCEISLVLKAHCPHFGLSSDGFSGYVKDQVDGVKVDGEWGQAIENVREYGILYHAEIEATRGGHDGEPNPYCDFAIILDKLQAATLVK